MIAKDRRRNIGSDRAINGQSDRIGFASIGDTANDFPGLQYRMDRHADGLGRTIIKTRKPAFTHLLTSASFVESYDMVDLRGLEISRRIIERQVAIFTDSNHCQIDWRLRPKSRSFGENYFSIGLSV